LKENVARDLGKALAPKEVVFIGDIPKTRNAKVMRRIVRAAYLGEKLGDTSALENPASLEEIKPRHGVGRVTACPACQAEADAKSGAKSDRPFRARARRRPCRLPLSVVSASSSLR